MIKLKKLIEIKATYKIITPMFIGDANKDATGISPQSFKGALRYWWRALAWSRIYKDKPNEVEALKELHRQEAVLFGSSADGEKKGKGKVVVKIKETNLNGQKHDTKHNILSSNIAARYLGYGVIDHKSILSRPCINEDQEFSVTLLLDDNSHIKEIKNALITLGLLSGLGSKNRKGYGSLALQKMECQEFEKWYSPKNTQDYYEMIKKILTDKIHLKEIPPYSAFSQNTSIKCVVNNKNDCYSVLNDYGSKVMMYRSWGKKGKDGKHWVLGNESEKNFRNDHDWSKGKYMEQFHPQRIIFGLPHNYYKIQVGRDIGKNKYGRRASPLFFHVHQIGNQFIGVVMILKSTFLPKNENIFAGRGKVKQNIEWSVILDKFILDDNRFPNSEKIFP